MLQLSVWHNFTDRTLIYNVILEERYSNNVPNVSPLRSEGVDEDK